MKKFVSDDIQQLIYLAKQNETRILKVLGFQTNGNKIQQKCPIHKGDNTTAFSYSLKLGIWSCFTHHCEHQFGNDIIGLIRALKNLSFIAALQWIDSFLKGEKVDFDLELNKTYHDVIYQIPDKNLILDESRLQTLSRDYSYMIERGFTTKTIEFFEGGLCNTNNPAHHRFMIPVRNFTGSLVGFTGRSIFKQCIKCKTFHDKEYKCPQKYTNLYCKWRHYGFKTASELYNIHNAKSYIAESKICCLHEGPLDVWAAWQLDMKNTIATFGTNLSFEQMGLLAQSGCLKIQIMFDGDEAGLIGATKIAKQSYRFFDIEITKCRWGHDPSELYLESWKHK